MVAQDSTAAEIQRLTTLCELLERLTRAETVEAVCEAGIASMLASTAADRAAVLTFDEQGIVRCSAWRDLSVEYRDALIGWRPWAPGTRDAKPLVIRDVQQDESLGEHRELLERARIRALAFIPLASDEGVFGEFLLCYAAPHECKQDELAMAQAIANHVAPVLKRKRAETAERKRLETATLRMAAIVENSEDAIASKDLNGIITSWNQGAERVFGYSASEAIGKPVSMLAAPDVVNEMPEILNKIRQGQRVEHYETRRQRKDGQVIHVSLSVSPVRDASGRIIGASKIARDISDRKEAEHERAILLSREQEARKTAELLNRVGSMLAAELALEKLVQSVTDVATELVGAEFGAFFHNVLDEKGESYMLYTLSGASREAFANFPMPRNTDVFGPTFRGERIVRSDDITKDPRYGRNAPRHGMPEGHLPVRSYLAAPVVSRSGEVLGGLFFGHSATGKFTEYHEGILTGITAQAAIAMDNARLFEQAQWIQNELKRSNEELRRANQDLETFAYSASHDLQEPLRTVAICAQLLERRCGDQLPDESREFLSRILQGAQRMQNLVRDILAYATATKHATGPPPSVDSGSVLATVLESLKAQVEQAGATVTSGPLPVLSVHEKRLAQVFQNLISNALKYRNKEAPRVHISAIERDGWWMFSVADNGIGIERKFADHIFGLFKRLHSEDEYPGSGVGLAICQRIVEQYGGRIWVERSTPGEGSTFCFSLPARAGIR